MGVRIARRIFDTGHDLVVWNRTPERAEELVELGVRRAATPATAASEAEILITMVSDPNALRDVSTGGDGIAAGAHSDLTVIEMSTVGPGAIADLRSTLPAGVDLLDAPVMGGVAEAEAGALTILVGGTGSTVERARPLLAELGSVVHVGPLGRGAAAKLVANAALFGSVALLGEAIALGRALGLQDDALYAVLAATPLAGQAARRWQTIAAGDYSRRFALSLARKDADLIVKVARAARTDLRLVEATRSWLTNAEAGGHGDRDYTVVLARILGARQDGPRPSPAPPDAQEAAVYDGLIIDLDGVVWLGGQPIDGAVAAVASLRARGTRLLFLTNDPTNSRAKQAARLAAIGIPASAENVMTSAAATARFLAGHDGLLGRPAFVIGSPAFQEEIADAGVELVSAAEPWRAQVVVVGGHTGFDFTELRAATRAIAAGAQLVAAGRDRFIPTADGPEPATGAIVAAVEAATGVTATIVGKPEPYMFEIAREALPDCQRLAVVGDNLSSDIAGAKRSGLDAILVLTGAATEADLDGAEYQPDLVLASLADLAAAPEAGRERHTGR